MSVSRCCIVHPETIWACNPSEMNTNIVCVCVCVHVYQMYGTFCTCEVRIVKLTF